MRFAGMIGVKLPAVEESPGIWTNPVKEVKVSGFLRVQPMRWQGAELAQEKAKANHVLTTIAHESTISDWEEILYVVWNNKKWAVKTIKYIRPRLELGLGGLYNG